MKQEEKSRQSRERILVAGMQAFGEKGYDGTSLNLLLGACGVSKGLFYHYYTNKDELYLACVQGCFDAMTERLSQVAVTGGAEAVLGAYFAARAQFFLESTARARVFFDALLQPPPHLAQAVAAARVGFEGVNRALFQRMLGDLPLGPDRSAEDALYYFEVMQRGAQLRYAAGPERCAREDLATEYENQARLAMELLLYGLTGRGKR